MTPRRWGRLSSTWHSQRDGATGSGRCALWQRADSRRDDWNTAYGRYQQLRKEAEKALAETGQRLDPALRYASYRTWARIGLEEPDRPTWSGDRINAVIIRLDRDLNVNLADLWPYLLLQLPDQARTEIITARNDLSRAANLAGWALLYAPLTWFWWPACQR